MKLPSLAIGAVPVVEFYGERGGVTERWVRRPVRNPVRKVLRDNYDTLQLVRVGVAPGPRSPTIPPPIRILRVYRFCGRSIRPHHIRSRRGLKRKRAANHLAEVAGNTGANAYE
jgi:hypothetical protein